MASAERARLRRLQRLEQVRAIDRDRAARDAATAESTLAQLLALAKRTDALAADYAGRQLPRDAAGLAATMQFHDGLLAIAGTARSETASLRGEADLRQQALAQAERRRAATDERLQTARRALLATQTGPAPGNRRALGTALEV